ncbi:MAG: hypothetical protein L3K16_05250 [Thermoplasmata archaeon]|nr:hypothetical protein [Thermoplasmata archaeon]
MNVRSHTGVGNRPRHRTLPWATIALVALLLPVAIPSASSPEVIRGWGVLHVAARTAGAWNILDGGTLTFNGTGSPESTITDREAAAGETSNGRAYFLNLTVTLPLENVSLRVWTYPVANWEFPAAFPWGAEALPPLPEWQYAVYFGAANDSTNWIVNESHGEISRSVPWENASFLVVGFTPLSLALSADPTLPDGTTPTHLGFNVNNGGLGGGLNTSDPQLARMTAALHPAVTRFGVTSVGSGTSWNNATETAKFDFTNFDLTANFSAAAGATIALNLPVGTWGDGNLLPNGMPLDLSMPIPYGGGVGYFPTEAAYASYVGVVVQHVKTTSDPVQYWLIGNEMPLVNASIVAEYIQLFNIAETTIHSVLPAALVGSDSMTNRTYFSQFASGARGVGFLSFHYYPATGICEVNGTYCAPNSTGLGTPDPRLWTLYAGLNHQGFVPPAQAQEMWKSSTGIEVPILDTESNLNAVGGSMSTYSSGTDPRLQSLFGAAWIDSTLIDGTFANLSELTYFMLSSPAGVPRTVSGPYGGWGFGLIGSGGSGGDIPYAPYLALKMWADAFPSESTGVSLSGVDPATSAGYAAVDGTNLSAVIVNQVDVPLHVRFAVTGANYIPTTVVVLDNRSYTETYHAGAADVTLGNDSVRLLSPTAAASGFTISGYGVAEIVEAAAPPSNTTGGGGGANQSGDPPQPTSPSNSSTPSPENSTAQTGSDPTHSRHATSGGFPASSGALPGPAALQEGFSAGLLILAGLVVVAAWKSGGSSGGQIVGRPPQPPAPIANVKRPAPTSRR